MSMRKTATVLGTAIIVITAILICFIKINKSETEIIRNVVLYKTSMTIGDLYDGNKTFDEIDRTKPEGTLFSKTKVESVKQLKEIKSRSERSDKRAMKIVQKYEISDKYKKEIRQQKPVFSFYYYGSYAPPYWFCFLESTGSSIRVPCRLELEDGKWREEGDIAKYPVLIAFFDLSKKHGMFNAKKKLTKNDIKAFINDCRNIDSIIAEGMATDPEHYERVEKLH